MSRLWKKDELLRVTWNERLLNEFTTSIFLLILFPLLFILLLLPFLASFSVVHHVRGFLDVKVVLNSFFLPFLPPFCIRSVPYLGFFIFLSTWRELRERLVFNLIPAPLFVSPSLTFLSSSSLHSSSSSMRILHLRPTPLTQNSCDHLVSFYSKLFQSLITTYESDLSSNFPIHAAALHSDQTASILIQMLT